MISILEIMLACLVVNRLVASIEAARARAHARLRRRTKGY